MPGLNDPLGVAVDPATGNFALVDDGSGTNPTNTVKIYDDSGNPVPLANPIVDAGPLVGVAFDASGDIWVTRYHSSLPSLLEFAPNGAPLNSYAFGGAPDLITIVGPEPVPEPSETALTLLAGLSAALGATRRRA